MSLTKYLNYYVDSSGYFRRIPWDTWMQDGGFAGLSPVGISTGDGAIHFDSSGAVSCDVDFIEIDMDGDSDLDITMLALQTDERTFREKYENVIGFYESEFSQTYEFDFDKPEYKE